MTSTPPKSGQGNKDRRDYEVGYGRPPVAHQFRRGQVANPMGRRKKPKPVGQIIQEALMTRITIEENGRRKTMTAQEVIIRNLVSAAARRDARAINTLFALKDRYQDSTATMLDPADLNTNDLKIIQEYLASLSTNDVQGQVTPVSCATSKSHELTDLKEPNE
jgi:Family of unknown function (DUF5681)